jgi:hypothetical protein
VSLFSLVDGGSSGRKTSNIVVLGFWCLMPLSTIFQLYRGGQFYCCSGFGLLSIKTNIFVDHLKGK